MKDKILKRLGTVACLSLFLGTPLASSQTEETTAAFRIGFIYSKTGRLAPYSRSVSLGAKLALQIFRKEHPELANKVQMIAADDESCSQVPQRQQAVFWEDNPYMSSLALLQMLSIYLSLH